MARVRYVNLEYNALVPWADGTNISPIKCLMFSETVTNFEKKRKLMPTSQLLMTSKKYG